MNSYMGGPYQQAISGVTNLNNNWYTAGGGKYQTYAFDYKPGAAGKVTWYVGENATWTVDGRSMGPNGNIGQRTVAMEPMSIVANFGISNSFASLNMTGLAALMPATMKFDYIRIYQPADETMITCDPPGYETTRYIAKHPEPYSNPNITRWLVDRHLKVWGNDLLTLIQVGNSIRLAQERLDARLQGRQFQGICGGIKQQTSVQHSQRLAFSTYIYT
jgi:hypothetical protein